jgi:hypothetical protein
MEARGWSDMQKSQEPTATRNWKGQWNILPGSLQKEPNTVYTVILDFWPPEV